MSCAGGAAGRGASGRGTEPPSTTEGVESSDAPSFAIGVPASGVEPDVGSALASLRASAARTGENYEIVVAVNGPGDAAVAGATAFAAATGAVVRVLRLPVLSKVAAWNAIRAATRAPVIVFADADVRVAPGAIGELLRRLAAEPALALVAGRESARLEPSDGLVARMAAIPYRFDFGSVPGRLYVLRTAALPEPMPVNVLAEDAYLSVRLGQASFAKERAAVVYLRPPLTWRDCLRQRVRNEAGKLQLAREFPELLARSGFGRYPWRAFLREIAPREYPLVALLLATRLVGRWRALRQIRHGFGSGWTVLPSTKCWVASGETSAPTRGRVPASGGTARP